MNDDRNGSQVHALTVGSIAQLVDGRVVGDASVEVVGVAPLEEATGRQMAFLATKRYAKHVAGSEAAAFLASAELESALPDGASGVVVDEPYPALRTLLHYFFPPEAFTPGIHPTAVIGRGVTLGEAVQIGPYVVLEDDVSIGDGTRIGSHSVVGRGTWVGARTRLHPHVVVYHGSVVGNDVIVHAGARLGADGFGYTLVEGEHRKMPQVGRCVVEDGVEIGANTTIDRGSLGDTVVGRGVKIDNLVQIAHNVRLGALTLVAALVGVAGSTRVGKRVWLGGQAGIINQREIGDDARIAVASVVTRDVPPGETVSGHPARPHRQALRKQARLGRLSHRVERLEEEIGRFPG